MQLLALLALICLHFTEAIRVQDIPTCAVCQPKITVEAIETDSSSARVLGQFNSCSIIVRSD